MNIAPIDDGYEAVLSTDELHFIHQTFNEVCHGLCLRDSSRIGKLDNAKKEMLHLATIYDNAVRSKESEVRIKMDFERAKMYRKIITIVCEEIEDWEFQTRTGGTRHLAVEMQKQLQNVPLAPSDT